MRPEADINRSKQQIYMDQYVEFIEATGTDFTFTEWLSYIDEAEKKPGLASGGYSEVDSQTFMGE